MVEKKKVCRLLKSMSYDVQRLEYSRENNLL